MPSASFADQSPPLHVPPRVEPRPVIGKSARGFVFGSIAGSFGMCIFAPFDTIKTRMQLQAGAGRGPLEVGASLVRTEGLVGLYAGLSASVARQVVYGGGRMGLFDIFQDRLKGTASERLPFWKNALASFAAGASAGAVANPIDVSLIRMQADGALPVAQRRGYTHVGNALLAIVRNEGVAGLATGLGPTMTRAMAANFGSLSFNASSKDWLINAGMTPGNALTCVAAMIGGMGSACFGMPFDFVKTQMQKQAPDPVTGRLPFRNSFECVWRTFQAGPLRFYTGFPVYIVRIAPFQATTLLICDKLKEYF